MPDIFVAPQTPAAPAPNASAAQRDYGAVMHDGKPLRGRWSTFVVRPQAIRFETQENEEEVLLLLRRHIITMVPWVVAALVASLGPFFAAFVPGFSVLPERFLAVGVVAWYLLVLGYVLENFLTWYFNVFMVTDERVIDVDFYSLIYRKISAAKIADIEDVTLVQSGVVRGIFDYGTVFIQTAGKEREFEFENVPHPRKVAAFLNEMHLEEEQEFLEGRVR